MSAYVAHSVCMFMCVCRYPMIPCTPCEAVWRRSASSAAIEASEKFKREGTRDDAVIGVFQDGIETKIPQLTVGQWNDMAPSKPTAMMSTQLAGGDSLSSIT